MGFYSSLLCLIKNNNIWWYIFQRLSRQLKVDLKYLWVPITKLTRQKLRTKKKNSNLSKPSWKAKTKPLLQNYKIMIYHILSSRVESSEKWT